MNKNYIYRLTRLYVLPAALLFIGMASGILAICCIVSGDTAICDNIEMWIDACSYMDFFFPLVVCIPFVPLVYYQKRRDFLRYAAIRCGRNRYIKFNLISMALMTVFSTAMAYFVTLVISVKVLRPIYTYDTSRLINYALGYYEVNHPFLFGAVWCFWKGLIAFLFVLFGSMLVLYTENLFVSVLSPFIYCMAENMITALLGFPEYSIVTTYVLNRLSPDAMHGFSYVCGVFTYIITAFLIILFVNYKDKVKYGYKPMSCNDL